MKRDRIYRIICFIDIVLWCFIVFKLSNQNGEESSGFSKMFLEFIIRNKTLANIVEPYIRKIAHLSEYAFGGMLFVSLFASYKWTDKKIMITSILLGAWYAILDEIHQLMIVERSGNIVDVYIDTLGVSIGVCATLIIIKVYEKIINHKKKTERVS